jgi:putative ABC transport system substrate-binding protein
MTLGYRARGEFKRRLLDRLLSGVAGLKRENQRRFMMRLRFRRSEIVHHLSNPGDEKVLSSVLRRRRFLTIALPLLLAPGMSWSAADGAPVRIGWLKIQGPQHTPGQLREFREGMRELGWVEGRDYVLDQRYADGDESRLPSLATELVGAGVSVIVATSQPSIAAAARVTKRVPVIGRMNDDPVANGMAQSLGRPGGNISGIYAMTEEMNPKRLALLKEVVASARRVGVLLRHDWPNAERAWQVAVAAARPLGVELIALNVRSADDLTAAFEKALSMDVGGIMTFRNPTVVTYLKLIAQLTVKNRLPAVFDAREYVVAGGLMSYGPNIDAIYRQLASYADHLLRGASAGEMPIEQPTVIELVVNKRTADTIGIPLSPSLLARADKVIE